ncbi:MAG: CBS domain-containing protein [Micropepsaceae bacterium]
MKVKDVMHLAATWVGPDAPLPDVAAHMRDEDVVPISQYDRLIGEVTKRDLAHKPQTKKLTARDVMHRPIIYCYPEEDAKEALRIMKKHAVRRLPVISHQKRLIGTVWLDDVKAEARVR